jgi:hypothetical protein
MCPSISLGQKPMPAKQRTQVIQPIQMTQMIQPSLEVHQDCYKVALVSEHVSAERRSLAAHDTLIPYFQVFRVCCKVLHKAELVFG